MRMTCWIGLLAAVAVLWVPGCSGGNEAGSVTGTVTVLQSEALPPGAELHVSLQDVSLQDAPAQTIAEQTLPVGGKRAPLAFALEYEASKIDDDRTYSVHAEIRVDGERRFISSQSYPVITHGAASTVEVVVMALASSRGRSTPLVGTYWRLTQLGGKPVMTGQAGREPHLTLLAEGRVAATAGCNQMAGEYSTTGTSLSFAPLTATRMMCPDVMEQEIAFANALAATASFAIDGDRLEIRDASDGVLARFEAAEHEE